MSKLRKRGSVVGTIIKVIIVIALIIVLGFVQNNWVFNTNYIFEDVDVPKNFIGYKIVQISDIMNNPMNTLDIVDKQSPNLILVTGNLSDTNGNADKSIELIKQLSKRYDTFYVLGETDSNSENINAKLEETNALNIEDICVEMPGIERTSEEFINEYIEGWYLKDRDNPDSEIAKYIEYTIAELEKDKEAKIEIYGTSLLEADEDYLSHIYKNVRLDSDNYKILVANQGQYVNNLANIEVDALLTGNTFGIDRFNTGYRRGIYFKENTTISISGGIGNNPDGGFRIFNTPQVITITLSDGTINNKNPLEKLLDRIVPDFGTRFDNDKGFSEYTYNYD